MEAVSRLAAGLERRIGPELLGMSSEEVIEPGNAHQRVKAGGSLCYWATMELGNIVGADVLNCFFVIGAAAAARPLAISPNFSFFHFPTILIILYSFRVFIFLSKDGAFRRWHGAWLLGIYLIYVILQYALNIGTVEG
jgi:Ca2+/Na+ antiporter